MGTTTNAPPWKEAGRKKKDPILEALERAEMAGHAYVPEVELLHAGTKGAARAIGPFNDVLIP